MQIKMKVSSQITAAAACCLGYVFRELDYNGRSKNFKHLSRHISAPAFRKRFWSKYWSHGICNMPQHHLHVLHMSNVFNHHVNALKIWNENRHSIIKNILINKTAVENVALHLFPEKMRPPAEHYYLNQRPILQEVNTLDKSIQQYLSY